jgi:diketogulonate reductase-like aldo/keto reductase
MNSGRAQTSIVTLNNGVQLPALGFGVFRSAPGAHRRNALVTGVRGGPDPDTIDTKLFTKTIPH